MVRSSLTYAVSLVLAGCGAQQGGGGGGGGAPGTCSTELNRPEFSLTIPCDFRVEIASEIPGATFQRGWVSTGRDPIAILVYTMPLETAETVTTPIPIVAPLDMEEMTTVHGDTLFVGNVCESELCMFAGIGGH